MRRTVPTSRTRRFFDVLMRAVFGRHVLPGFPESSPTLVFPDHELAHRYLDGYTGIEVGRSSHNKFNLVGTCLNVDFTDATDTEWKQDEIERTGETCPVDIVAEGDNLPLADDSQDYVLSSHSLEHFPDPVRTLKEWVR